MTEPLIFMHGGRLPRCVATVDKSFTYHLLQLMTGGGVELWCDQTRHSLSGLNVWLCRPGPHYYFHETPRGRPWNHRYLAFTGPLASQWATQGLLPRQPQSLAGESLIAWRRRFDRLIDVSQSPSRWDRLRAVNLLEAILIDLGERRDSSLHAPPAWLTRVIETIQSPGEVDYPALAASEHMSLSALQRRFKAMTGMTLHAMRIEHRIARGRALLGETDRPVKQIADDLGYRDVFYFTRQFTKVVGVPPATYRHSRQVSRVQPPPPSR